MTKESHAHMRPTTTLSARYRTSGRQRRRVGKGAARIGASRRPGAGSGAVPMLSNLAIAAVATIVSVGTRRCATLCPPYDSE